MRAHRRCVRFERKATLCGRRCGAQAERLRTGQLVTSSLVWDDVHVRQSTTLRSRSAGTLSRRRKEANPPTGSSGPRTWSSKRTGSGGSPASSSALLAHSVRQRLADMGGAPSAILIWSMGIPHWMLPPPAIATKRRRHGAEESRTVGGAEGRVRRPSDRRLRGGAPSRSGDLCGPSNGKDCRGVAVAVMTRRPGTGTHPRAGLANLPRQPCPGLEVWGSTSPRLQRLRSSPERLPTNPTGRHSQIHAKRYRSAPTSISPSGSSAVTRW